MMTSSYGYRAELSPESRSVVSRAFENNLRERKRKGKRAVRLSWNFPSQILRCSLSLFMHIFALLSSSLFFPLWMYLYVLSLLHLLLFSIDSISLFLFPSASASLLIRFCFCFCFSASSASASLVPLSLPLPLLCSPSFSYVVSWRSAVTRVA